MKNINIEKTCLNCNNFRRHYTKGVSDMFITEYGHCISYAMHYKLMNIYQENPACEFWHPPQEPKSEGERIISTLETIKRKLCLIELLLKVE